MIDAITNGFSGSTEAQDRVDLSREQFIDLLVTEMTHQDPMEPMDNSDFLNQLVDMNNLEAVSALTDGMNSMKTFTTITSATAMIGKEVTSSADGEITKGIVEKVKVNGGDVKVVINGEDIELGSITEIAGV